MARLRDCAYLTCAKGTRQSPVYTRQTVNSSRQTTAGKELVCRVLYLGHTANTLPCALLNPRQNKVHALQNMQLHIIETTCIHHSYIFVRLDSQETHFYKWNNKSAIMNINKLCFVKLIIKKHTQFSLRKMVSIGHNCNTQRDQDHVNWLHIFFRSKLWRHPLAIKDTPKCYA